MRALAFVAILAGAVLAAAAPAAAAEVAVISTVNMRVAIDGMKAGFDRRGPDTLAFTPLGAAAVNTLMESGQARGDVVIASRAMIEAYARAGLVRPESVTDVAHSSIGVAVRAGAPRPSVATDEAFRRALLAARSIAYPNGPAGSMGGLYIDDMLARMGLSETLKPRIQIVNGGAPTAEAVASGKAELGLNQVAELKQTPGLEVLEPLPPILTDQITMTAAILTKAANPEGAARWIAYMRTEEVVGALKAGWMGR